MPIVFTKDEIKQFLDEQGFDVSDEDTLRKFILDLKKLIKFEEMKRRRRKLGHFPDDTLLDSTDGRHAHTTTTSGQEESDDDDGVRKGRRYPNQRSPQRPPVAARERKSPIRRQQGRPQEKLPSGYYETDETSSYEHDDTMGDRGRTQLNKQKDSKRAPLPEMSGVQIDGKKVPVTQQAASAPSKKPGNRLIMKRFTAHQGVNGDSVIEESDIDLGPVRRPGGYRPLSGSRPQTAPVNRNGKPEVSRKGIQRPISQENQDECDDDEIDADELLNALNQLIFPDEKDSRESLCDSDRTKALLKPPPHVARDPVALYHWYKTYNWDVYTIPGEDRHMKLRWNVRAHTVGGYHPCVEYRKYRPKSSR